MSGLCLRQMSVTGNEKVKVTLGMINSRTQAQSSAAFKVVGVGLVSALREDSCEIGGVWGSSHR